MNEGVADPDEYNEGDEFLTPDLLRKYAVDGGFSPPSLSLCFSYLFKPSFIFQKIVVLVTMDQLKRDINILLFKPSLLNETLLAQLFFFVYYHYYLFLFN